MIEANGKCNRCGTPFEKAAKVEILASGIARWCADCWASEKAIRAQIKTTGPRINEASEDFFFSR